MFKPCFEMDKTQSKTYFPIWGTTVPYASATPATSRPTRRCLKSAITYYLTAPVTCTVFMKKKDANMENLLRMQHFLRVLNSQQVVLQKTYKVFLLHEDNIADSWRKEKFCYYIRLCRNGGFGDWRIIIKSRSVNNIKYDVNIVKII